MGSKELQVKCLSSMAKVFPNRIVGSMGRECHVLRGQEVSFQVAYCLKMKNRSLFEYRLRVVSHFEKQIEMYTMETVPSMFPVYPASADDGDYITRCAGLFPDPLIPLKDSCVTAIHGTWRAIWFSIRIAESVAAGNYPVEVWFCDPQNNEVAAKVKYCIRVEDFVLPPQRLLFTQWFHCDSIADAHHVPVYSEAHWGLIECYMKLASSHGMNMILTPIVTPPLDTAVGGERKTVQLVMIEKNENGYSFDFTLLRRYIQLALHVGMKAFEISHFFTQWGAGFAPKVVAKVNGRMRRIFGWETHADDPSYAEFLRSLIPAVIECFEQEGVHRDQLWFHVSDEPTEEHLKQYEYAVGILHPLIEGCHHMDALSSYAFYQKNLVKSPVVCTDHIGAYLEAQVKDLWCYYCCCQGYKVSNRFLAMPSYRNRIMGVQLYKHGIKGFLHWGYNFYYTQFAAKKIDPYAVTDAGAAFPSGDSFSVYPYEDGAVPSLRQKVFSNALEDVRLLELLENKIGRTNVLKLIEQVAGMDISFTDYPREETFFERLYDAIFEKLKS